MLASNDALIELFNALLEVSQLDAGTINVRANHHSLQETMNLLIDEFQEATRQKGLALEFDGRECIVYTDPILLMRILRNLLSNAVKFTESGHITLKLIHHQQDVEVQVRDTGIGIHEIDQQTIFREYTQLGNPSRDRSKGIGLGLALVRRMCDLLELEIDLKSTPGAGSSFSLKVPFGNPDQVVQLNQELDLEPIQGLDVMVIDDEIPILEAMEALFSEWSCRARTFTTLDSAFKTVADTGYKPDLIISDYRLNEQANGIGAIARLRLLFGESVPSIIISGDTDPKLLEKIHNAEFFLLHKPVRAEKLRKVVGLLLDGGIRDNNKSTSLVVTATGG